MKGQNNPGEFVGLLVPMIFIGAIGIPIINDVAQTVNATGTTSPLLSYIPFALMLAMFVGAIALVRPHGSPGKKEKEKEESSDNSDNSEESKPGIKVLGYRVAW